MLRRNPISWSRSQAASPREDVGSNFYPPPFSAAFRAGGNAGAEYFVACARKVRKRSRTGRQEMTMRAISVNEYGAAPALTDVPDPRPQQGQVLIKVEAAGINPMDRTIADGAWKEMMPASFPLILGADLAGVVEAVGEGAGRFLPGDQVFGQLLITPLGSAGTYAERVAVTQDAPLARLPKGLEPTIAAALPTAGGTALEIVESVEPLTGKTVLMVGAAGGVGSFATQLAANAGAQVIAVAPASADDRMRDYGAAETVDRTETSV